MMPSRDQTGFTHFTSSTTSGSASLMSLRILLKVSPRQSPSSAILLSIRADADWPSLESDPFMFSSRNVQSHSNVVPSPHRERNSQTQRVDVLGDDAPLTRRYVRHSGGRRSGLRDADEVVRGVAERAVPRAPGLGRRLLEHLGTRR